MLLIVPSTVTVFAETTSEKIILPHYDLQFSLPEDILYEEFFMENLDESEIFDLLKIPFIERCESRTSGNPKNIGEIYDEDYFRFLGCKKVNFLNEESFEKFGKFYLLEFSNDLKFSTLDKSSNPIYDSETIQSWIMYGQFENGGIFFYPSHDGFDAEFVSTGTSGYVQNFQILESPEPKLFLDSFKKIYDDQIFLKKKTPVNVFIIGNEPSDSDLLKLKFKLPQSNSPILPDTNQYLGIEYQYDYNFVFIDTEKKDELKNMIINNSFSSNLPTTMCEISCSYLITNENFDLLKQEYRLIDAVAIENHLHENFIKGKYDDMANIFFLNYDFEELNFHRNYILETNDYSYGEKFNAIGLMGYGGQNELYFIDLYSLPWKQMNNTNDFVIQDSFKSQLACEDCQNELIIDYTADFLKHIVNPYFVYDPGVYSEINVDILIYQKRGGSAVISETTLPKFINIKTLENQLSSLYPHAKWNFHTVLTDNESRDLDRWMIDELENLGYYEDESGDTFYGARYIPSHKIAPILEHWVDSKPKNHFDKNTKNIPVLIYLHTTPYDVFIDNYGTTGFAFPDYYSLEGCCVFAVVNGNYFWETKYGATDLILHEIGHIMGLNHPFHSMDKENSDTNNFWNFNISPMIYADPKHPDACAGVFNNILFEREVKSQYGYGTELQVEKTSIEHEPLYGKLCGISEVKFTKFEKNRIMDAMIGLQLQQANTNIQHHKVVNEEINQNTISEIESLIKKISYEYSKSIPNNELALQYATDANNISQSLMTYSDSFTGLVPSGNIILDEYLDNDFQYAIFLNSDTITQNFPVTLSIKGNMSDLLYTVLFEYDVRITSLEDFKEHEFSMGVSKSGSFDFSHDFDYSYPRGDYELCIDNYCMIFSLSKELELKENNVPDWIKNNAKWWADGQVDDSTFTQGIGFLIKEKIIGIASLPEQASDVAEQKVPDWIKNNAGWWADGMISEDDFIKGITYLVESGIIKVD